MSPAERAYMLVAQQIYDDWRFQRGPRSALARELFTLDHSPESFLTFGDVTAPAIFVTTNPGRGFEYQLHPSIRPGGLFDGVDDYPAAAAKLGEFYGRPRADIAIAARANIAAMKRIARQFGATGVRQIEMIPWHSVSLPDKRGTIARLLAEEPSYKHYRTALDELLKTHPLVLSWSAGTPLRRSGAGMEMKAEQIGLDLGRAHILPLERRRDVSQALLWQLDGATFRGLFVTQGAASLPSAGVNRSGQDQAQLLSELASQLGFGKVR